MTQFQDVSLTFQEMLKNNLQQVHDSWQLHGRHSEMGELRAQNTDRNRKALQVLKIKKGGSMKTQNSVHKEEIPVL